MRLVALATAVGCALLLAAGAAGGPSVTGNAAGKVTVNGKAFRSGTLAYGSTIDVTKGTLTLKTSRGRLTVRGDHGRLARFILTDSGDTVALKLAGGDFSKCRTGSKKVVRALHTKGKGRWRTVARYLSGTVHGTQWLTEDMCSGATVVVLHGRVDVEDFTRHKTKKVSAGHRYTARPKS